MADIRETWELKKADEALTEVTPSTPMQQPAAPQLATFGAKVRHACNVFLSVVLIAGTLCGVAVGAWYANDTFGAPNFANAASFLARTGNPDLADLMIEMGKVCDNNSHTEHSCASLLKEAGAKYAAKGYGIERQMVKIAKAEEPMP